MKKGLTIVGVILAVIIVAMIAIPFLFKGKIKDAVLSAANEQLNAKVDIKDFGLNLFSNFPNATLSLDDATVIGVGDFEKDTLLQAQSASVTIDLMSLFGSNYNISKINLDKASVYAKILADGRVNYDIMKVDSTATVEAESETPFKLNLKKVSLNDCNVVYQDDSTKMKVVLNKWNGEISGDFSASETTLKTSSTIDEVSFIMDGIPYLNRVKAIAKATVNANLDNMKFTFTESDLQLNELKASIDGSFAMVGKDYEGMDFDLKLNAPDTQFKDILSLLPAMYTADFKDVKTSGTASLDAYIKGLMQDETYPAFDVKILVNNAMFQYPSLPKSVNDINVAIAVNSKGGSLDNTVIDISKFSFNLGGNPFSGNLNITTPMSDPNLKAHANGTINLGMIKEVYPLEKGTELNGTIAADLNIATRMSAIEKEQYENVSASGSLKLSNMVYKGADMPEVLINNAALEFTPRYVNLPALDVKIGKNDISANGRLENFIAYALKDQTLKGQLNIKSNYLNANDFISSETSGAAADTTATSEDIIIPKNIDFTLNAALNQIVYGKMNITNMVGAMTVRNGILTLNNVGANALGGSCKVSGSYNTSDPKTPKVDFDIALSKVSFAETFKSVESIQKFAPIFENLLGTYSMNLKFNTSLGQSIMQTLASLTGSGALQTSDIKVQNVAALTALSSALKTDALKTISPKDLNLPFSIDNGKLITKPFNINIGNGGMMKLEGSTGLDQSINYKGTVTLPKSMANNFINNVPITIGGTFSNPKIGVDTKGLLTDAASSLANQLLGGKDGDASASLSEEKAKQIEKLRTEADNTAKKLVEEAEKQSQALVDKAGSNPLAKTAAKAAGKKLVQEAEKQGQNLRNKAEEQIKKLEGSEAAPAE
ncbi:AsmA family protein [Dysgonomonas sp. Marseille-P4677]|uniref:AsmA-like C-terminal region-containing protein n=1 Tax=Dysgonomonas sp. Marseille-P4677 TaxID=2364790 RepID=UPI0019139AE8|nr:AsmA-like C-terminal region-containing protein [Dysgonomonas sp. Marseille-P4677]MBK5720223.1 AsmA family protein [Dysgonomonas sp. Marseille-P4677]